SVDPGSSYTYTWLVPERAGPGPADGSSVLWMYHGHVDEVVDTNTGLIGPIIVTAKGQARPDGSPADVDREIITELNIYDENLSAYLDQNVNGHLKAKAAPGAAPELAGHARQLDHLAAEIDAAAADGQWSTARLRADDFDNRWDDVEDGFRAASRDNYRAIETEIDRIKDLARDGTDKVGVHREIGTLRGILAPYA